jgi:hypothetical protein
VSYRDDDEAMQLRHDDLVRELASLESKVADHRRVTEELAHVRQYLAQREARRGPVRLDKLKIASPCKQRWEDMVGDERVRVCAGCERPVFNLSAMTMEDAEAVLATRGVTPCVRFYQRADGTVMTSDCPVGRRPRRVGLAVAAGALAAVSAGVFGVSRATKVSCTLPALELPAAPEPEPEPMMGGLASEPYEELMGDPAPELPPAPHMGVPPVYDGPDGD